MISNKSLRWLVLLTTFVLLSRVQILHAQAIGASGELKWLRINSLHSYFSEQGSEAETGGTERRNVTFTWPGEYGIIQSTMRSKGMWLGCTDYYDSKVDKVFQYLVTNVGPKPNEYSERPIFDAEEFKLIGRFDHPAVYVDGESATTNSLYDVLDGIDKNLIADRMIVVKNHTSIGVTVTKRVYAFTQQYHDNYYIYDYVLKNTGIIDNQGTENPQQIKDLWFYLTYRYALSGESVYDDVTTGERLGWGIDNSSWGRNVVNDVVGTNPNDPNFEFRAHFAWYGPHSQRPLDLEDDWGCPNEEEDGIMAAAKFVGHMALHADKSPQDPSDDPYQPRTTHYINSDSDVAQRASTQYDEVFMTNRYTTMNMGHAERTQAEEVELSGQAANDWGPGIGGTTSVQGFGPYTLDLGDSIHIVVAGGVAGISREKNREVGGNWLQYYKGTGTPTLVMPNGSTTSNHTEYKKAWVWTCKDSIMETFRRADQNYQSGYSIPQPPPPPNEFSVTSGGDRIRLSWSDNATSWPNFDGYVIYRSEGNVMVPKTEYKKIYECNGSDVVHTYDDTSAVRGFDYYYYIRSKDNGSQNIIEPGKPLMSGMFWTLTSKPAYLRRMAGTAIEQVRVVPNPYDIRARMWQFGADFQYDRIAFYEIPPMCKLKIFTERGDLIWEKYHDDGSGDELWDSMTSSRQIIVSGIYILYVEVTEDYFALDNIYANRDIYDPHTKELIAREGDLLYNKGEQVFKQGESVYRKFVVIR